MKKTHRKEWVFRLRFNSSDSRIIRNSGIEPDQWREWMVRRAESAAEIKVSR